MFGLDGESGLRQRGGRIIRVFPRKDDALPSPSARKRRNFCQWNRGRAREETDMDFIERLFGVAPDGGNGTLELLYFIVGGLAISATILRRRIREILTPPRA